MVNVYKIESLIKEKGWSNTYFSSLFDKSRSWLVDMKHGKGLPDENTLACIADKLGTTIEYLTDVSEQKNKPSAEARGLTEIQDEILRLFDQMTDEQQKSFMVMARSISSEPRSKDE